MARLLRICFSVILVWGAGLAAATAQKIDPALFGALPLIKQAEISPNGETVAVLQNAGGQSNLVFVELSDPSAAPKGVGIGDAKARSIQWIDDEYILLLTSVTKEAPTTTGLSMIEFWRWIAISKTERKLKLLFKQDAGVYVAEAGKVLSTTPGKPGEAVMARWTPTARVGGPTTGLGARFTKKDSGTGYSLFNVNLKSGREKILYAGKPETVDWVVDANGDPIFRIDYDKDRSERKIFRRKSGKSFELVRTISEPKGPGATISFHGLNDAGDLVLATIYAGDKRALVGVDPLSGEVTTKLYHHDRYDIDTVSYDPASTTVQGITYIDDLPRIVQLNPADQKLQENLAAAIPGAAIKIVSRSASEDKMLVRATYTDRPAELFIFDKHNKNLAFFSSSAPGLADRVYAERSKFDYVAPDGLAINGYLTTPPSAAKSNLPLIVLPHGGPEGRDDQAFDWWAFFYAARGYAVYQPNFRGSDGYGLDFRRAGYGEWGRKMQDDISNGLKKLIADGIADPTRVCIVGASYGGYASLAGATLTPDLYACAVSVNGVSDLSKMIGEAAVSSSQGAAYWERRIGSRFRNANELAAVSPARRAANAGPPIMLIHGKDDTVVPFYQSEIMRDALVSAGKDYVFVELSGEDHWLSSGVTRTGMLSQSIDFIDRHIGGE